MPLYLTIVKPNSDMLSDDKIELDAFSEMKYGRYVEDRKTANSLWKLYNHDFSRLEQKYNIPEGTIEEDMHNFQGISLRTRFSGGEMILVETEDDMTPEILENYINSLSADALKRFIDEAKI